MPGLEAALAAETEANVAKVLGDTPPVPAPAAAALRTVPRPTPTLSDMWATKERVEHELRARIRREKAAIAAAYDRDVLDLNTDYDRRIDEAITRFEAQRRTDLQTLADATAEKLREHDKLAQRMG